MTRLPADTFAAEDTRIYELKAQIPSPTSAPPVSMPDTLHNTVFRQRIRYRWVSLAAGVLAIWTAAAAQPSGRDVSTPSAYPAIPSQAAMEASARQSNPLIDFARHLDGLEPRMLADFAWIALDEMYTAYEHETIALDAGKGGLPMTHPEARWMIATRSYAERLRAIADTMSTETPIEIRVEDPGMLLVYVDGQVVEVSGPRIAEPNYMGQRIIERFCEIHPCDFLVTAPEPSEKTRFERVEAVWSFADGRGPVCVTNNGLEFRFADLRELARKRSACVQVAEQLRDLSLALREAADTGVAIDWSAVEIISTGAGRPEQVVLNRRGDYLLLSVPSLAISRTLQQISLSWVRARVRGEAVFQSFPHAERLLAPLLPSG